MMAFLLGQCAHAIGETKRFGKIRELVDSLDPFDFVPFHERPFWDLRFEFEDLRFCRARGITAAGRTFFVGKRVHSSY